MQKRHKTASTSTRLQNYREDKDKTMKIMQTSSEGWGGQRIEDQLEKKDTHKMEVKNVKRISYKVAEWIKRTWTALNNWIKKVNYNVAW